ncbi:MAG: hypothetical protein LBG07_03785, partial [Treponema sp.]|nr:hypothetical protein [Treponema sp.]
MAIQQDEIILPPESQGLTFEKVWAMFQESDRRMKETERILQEKMQETDRILRENQKMMGDLGRKFGTVIEHMFIPNLKEKFNALGYVFERSSPNVLIGSKEHGIYAEIDVFLENGNTALAVEVKT